MEMTRCAQCLKDNAPQFLTVEEVAQLLRVSKNTAYRLVESGDLKSIRIARSIRVRAADLDDYLTHVAPVA